MSKRYTIQYVEQYLLGKNIKLLSDKYYNNKQKILCECLLCNYVWSTRFDVLIRVNGCPGCANNAPFDINFVKQYCKTRNIKLLSSVYKGSHKKLEYSCNVCNFIWSTTFGSIKNGSHGCPKCGKSLKLTLEHVEKFLLTKNIQLLSKEYINSKTKLEYKCSVCNFVWFTTFSSIKNNSRGCPKCSVEKRKQTCLKNLGVEWPTQNKEVRLKCAKSANKIIELKHWFSNETISCQGSYEVKVVKFYNKNQIAFLWQPQTFTIPDGRTYTPDCYLPDQDLWIEIKGRWYDDALEKWEWFHKEYPNSELWDKNKLKQLGIL